MYFMVAVALAVIGALIFTYRGGSLKHWWSSLHPRDQWFMITFGIAPVAMTMLFGVAMLIDEWGLLV